MVEREKDQTFGLFEFVGAFLRFPVFLLIVGLKLFVQFPFELIIFKIIGSSIMIASALGGFISSLLFSNRRHLDDSKETLKEVFELLFDFECFDFTGTIRFLKYGRFE